MCGVVGILGHDYVAQDMYDALVTLQHRGQDAAGIITFNGSSDYLEVYGRLFVHSGTDSQAQFGKKVFGAFLLSTT